MNMTKQVDERLMKLKQAIRDIISDSGLRTYPFHKKYGFNAKGEQDISASTFAGYANRPKSLPDAATFSGLSKILSRAKGYEVPASYLMGLCDIAQPEYDMTEDVDKVIDSAPARADLLVRQFEDLPYFERSRISPKLLRAIAEDTEYSVLDEACQVSWLVKREMNRQGMGTDKFANEFVGLPPEMIRDIVDKKAARLTKNQVLRLSSRIHNIDGDILTEIEDVQRSLFALVLAPQLFVEG